MLDRCKNPGEKRRFCEVRPYRGGEGENTFPSRSEEMGCKERGREQETSVNKGGVGVAQASGLMDPGLLSTWGLGEGRPGLLGELRGRSSIYWAPG